jgi:malonate-semialdehyde dehydrogenase (acetylating)/methylmalonate-semialdehyde dehydrogenase
MYVCMYVGAKNHATVIPDADREQTVNAIVGAAFGAAGQRLVFMYVVYVSAEVHTPTVA